MAIADKPMFFPLLSEIAAFKLRQLAIPDALHKARLTLLDGERAISTIKKRITTAKGDLTDSENEMTLEVAEDARRATNDSPHAALTNETARKAEAKRRLSKSAAHQTLAKILADLEVELFNAEAMRTRLSLDVQKIEDEQRALRTHADLTCAEAWLQAAGR